MAAVRFCDETDFSFGWVHPDPPFMARAGHAIRSGGAVWVIDPPDGDGVEERIRALGTPGGVVQLLDRHPRDNAALAARLGVAHHDVPFGGVEGAPFEVVTVWRLPLWKEVALWFEAERVLVVAEALAAAPGFVAPGERIGVHPMRRMLPPGELARFDAEHLLLGHGEGLHGREAVRAGVTDALRGSRRRIPQLAVARIRQTLPF